MRHDLLPSTSGRIAAAACAALVATVVALVGGAGADEADPVLVSSSADGDVATVVATTTTFERPPSTSSTPATAAPRATSTTVPPTTTTVPPTTTTTLPPFDPGDQAPGWEQRWGEAALARINFDPAQVGYTVQFLPARPGYYGMTYPNERRIDIWVRPAQPFELLLHVLAHELGHAVDLTWNDDARRGEYLQIRGLGSRNWFTCDGCTDFSTPAGDFAEVFAYWAVGGTDFKSTLAPAPSPEQLDQIVRFFVPPG